MKPWSPWTDRDRPTATSITDEELDNVLERLRLNEKITDILLARYGDIPPLEQGEQDLIYAFRALLHSRHGTRAQVLANRNKLAPRMFDTADKCRLCTLQAATLAAQWADARVHSDERMEARLKALGEAIARSPYMAWSDEDTYQMVRRELPWMMHKMRRLQSAARREQASWNRCNNQNDRLSQANDMLKRENARLRAELAKHIADKI